MKFTRVKLFLLVVAGSAALYLFYVSFKFQLITIPKIIHWVEMAHDQWWLTILFYALFILGVMGLPITMFPIIGGVLLEFWIALPMNIFAATLGAWLSFKLARILGRETVQSYLKGKSRFFDRVVTQEGFKSVFFLRLVGIPPFIVTNYALGLSAVKSRDFIIGTICGIFPWTTLITYAARSLWQALVVGGEKGIKQALPELMLPLFIISLAIVISSGITMQFRERRRRPRN